MSKKGWLAELDEAEKAATEGPWSVSEVNDDDWEHGIASRGIEGPNGVGLNKGVDYELFDPEDVTLIVLSRNHMRALLELVHEAVQLVDEGQLVVSDMATGPDQDLEFRQWLDKYHEAIGDER